jgi:hypothetical protein
MAIYIDCELTYTHDDQDKCNEDAIHEINIAAGSKTQETKSS